MPKYKLVNNELFEITGDELTWLNAHQKAWEDGQLPAELADLREKRNKLLLESDWIELTNAPLTSDKKTEWQTYRTNLRNLTNGLDTVDKVINAPWPTKP